MSRSQPSGEAQWLQAFIRDVDERTPRCPTELLPCVNRLKELIESKPQLRMWAAAMFEEVPNKVPYNAIINQASPPRSQVRGYEHMIELLNVIVSEVPPTWTLSTTGNIKLMGAPVQAILDWAMGTPSGHALFLDAQVNACFKEILGVWRDELLATSKSRSVITNSPGNWLSPEAVAAIEEDANLDRDQCHTFEELFVCDPRGDPVHWGFKSFDDFFVRRFRDFDKLRPVGYPEQSEWVVNACESKAVAIKSHVKEVDSFWLKAANYSILEMLNYHELAEQFVGGTVHQSVLLTTSYHRWNAPVSGSVVYAEVIAGAYFSERSTNGIGSEPVSAPLHNLVYLSHVATRAVVFIQADEPVGLMCFVGIGIADVSSCEILPEFMTGWPKKIKKGDELGMFHYGGSSQCLLFRRGLKLAFTEGALPGNRFTTLPVRSPLALAYE
ncbi:hypothetical protein ARSEF4850_002877 [Beauveria asiatica]